MYESLKGILEKTLVFYDAETSYVVRTDGILKYISNWVDLSILNTAGVITLRKNNAIQVTATAQPRLVGGIAPGSKVAASNQNGEARYFTHTPISFAANEAWSVTVVLNWMGGTTSASDLFGSVNTSLRLRTGSSNTYAFTNEAVAGGLFGSTNNLIGKVTILTFVALGNNILTIYVNGVSIGTIASATDVVLNRILMARGGTIASALLTYLIQSSALTAPQVVSLHSFLRTKYPEIESTVIGTQEWSTRNFEAVATPAGNVINNVTENGAVEKITATADRDFSSDTGWWTKGTGWTIGSNVASSDGSQTDVSNLQRLSAITTGKWHKVVFTVSGRSAGTIKPLLGTATTTAIAADGTYTVYIKSVGTSILFQADADFVGSIDNVSVEELNWTNATTIYDAVYAATAGTAAQKEYAALKEAAMWCYYNNDAANGAIYGKLYNWYAAKLLDLDMVTAGFGWRVPTAAQFTTLANALGGAAVAGGKIKMTGLNYWNTPNTGADNSSGLTILGGGFRSITGSFSNINTRGFYWGVDGDNAPVFILRHDQASASLFSNDAKTQGGLMRLIKTT